MIARFLFLLLESIKGLFRAKIPALISSMTIAITLIVFTIAYFGYINFYDYSMEFKKRYRIDVFFDTEISGSDAKSIFQNILLIDGIKQGKYIDKKEAAEIFKVYFNAEIEKVIGNNPLPLGGKFEVTSRYRNPSAMELIVRKIKKIEGIDQASFRSGLITRIDNIIENLLNICIIVGIAIFILAIILVSNTIRLIIHNKKRTIETLDLLGATKSFIRFPFLLEGIFQGILGAIIALSILWLLFSLLQYILSPILQPIHINAMNIIIGNLLIGSTLGLIGSYQGVSKYL